MKIIESVETVIDTDLLEKVIKEHACAKEMPRMRKWVKRIKTEGTLFIRKQYKMSLKEYQSVYFSRFETFVAMATVRKDLTCTME